MPSICPANLCTIHKTCCSLHIAASDLYSVCSMGYYVMHLSTVIFFNFLFVVIFFDHSCHVWIHVYRSVLRGVLHGRCAAGKTFSYVPLLSCSSLSFIVVTLVSDFLSLIIMPGYEGGAWFFCCRRLWPCLV